MAQMLMLLSGEMTMESITARFLGSRWTWISGLVSKASGREINGFKYLNAHRSELVGLL